MTDSKEAKLLLRVAKQLQAEEQCSLPQLAESTGASREELTSMLRKLDNMGLVEQMKSTAETFIEVTKEGALGLAEAEIVEALLAVDPPELPIETVHTMPNQSRVQLGVQQCMRKKLAVIDKTRKCLVLTSGKSMDADEEARVLNEITLGKHQFDSALDMKTVESLKRRKLLEVRTVNVPMFKATDLGLSQSAKDWRVQVDVLADLSSAIIREKELLGEQAAAAWAAMSIKQYNFAVPGRWPAGRGAEHPLTKQRKLYASVFSALGFQEQNTQSSVESSFYNFDALYQPQSHPARDAQDTFFVTETGHLPADRFDASLTQRIKKEHENGVLSNSLGWQYSWSPFEAGKRILRTHTTAVSARSLHEMTKNPWPVGLDGAQVPVKIFSIDRVFRNETLDATHLAEFHQVEGLVVSEKQSTLTDLINILSIFFETIGIKPVKFKPAYNPYTEPSLEVFGVSPSTGKWMEIGNSGVFRPEMLAPIGFVGPLQNLSIIAWGLSLERPTMIATQLPTIRSLFGNKATLIV